MQIVRASRIHKDFILGANKLVNEVSGLTNTRLDEFIDDDLFCEKPKFNCLIAVENDKPIGMCIYSDIYMANHGLGYYLANVYVVPEFRKKNVFNAFLQTIKESKKYNFMFGFVGEENVTMQDILNKIGAKDTGLKSYFLKIDE